MRQSRAKRSLTISPFQSEVSWPQSQVDLNTARIYLFIIYEPCGEKAHISVDENVNQTDGLKCVWCISACVALAQAIGVIMGVFVCVCVIAKYAGCL